ncbi:hypothetical protein [Bradyrhizobium sp. Tv2a-2]|uniref:hypothetical protein n=1 Tax=Bradyrhizobium sp. Tv2a-2 TaxID=113395 RepID=UPI0005647517|nr:hypothetical protein [Bradyrhizobium sp. Tv2a-2]
MLNSVTPPQAALESPASGSGGLDGADQLRHEQEFAALQRAFATEQLDAQPASPGNGMMSAVEKRLDDISSSFRVDPTKESEAAGRGPLVAGDPAAIPSSDAAASSKDVSFSVVIAQAIKDFRVTAAFEIQAHVVATSTNTSTKTFSQLLKGS